MQHTYIVIQAWHASIYQFSCKHLNFNLKYKFFILCQNAGVNDVGWLQELCHRMIEFSVDDIRMKGSTQYACLCGACFFQMLIYFKSKIIIIHMSSSRIYQIACAQHTSHTHTNCKHKYIFSVQERNKNPFSKWRRKHQVNMIFLQQRANEIKMEHGRKKETI